MRGPGWLMLFILILLNGCAAPPVQPPTYARLLDPSVEVSDVTEKLRPPPAWCEDKIDRLGTGETRLMTEPLEPAVRERYATVLRHLHPTAKRVLSRVDGLWPVENLKGAAAVFVPCGVDVAEGRGGYVLVDVAAFPVDRALRDAAVPGLYWRALAGGESRPRSPWRVEEAVPMMTDHAVRYLILHELGHALSIYAGEFDLDERDRIRITRMDGFAGFSWKFVTTEGRLVPRSPDDQLVRSVIPRVALDTVQWGSVLNVIDGPAAMLSPGYQLAERQNPMTRTLYVCAAAANLPLAGFVTPTAARYPTEDYAEMFAHAILSDEGKIHPTGTVPIDLPLCEIKSLPSPYFVHSMRPKRAYMEQALAIRSRPDLHRE